MWGGDGLSEANLAQLIGEMKAAFTSDYSNVNLTPRDEYTASHRANHTHARRAIAPRSPRRTRTPSPQAAPADCS
jgi:hypothetical protein